MDIFNEFMNEIRIIVREEIYKAISERESCTLDDRWINKNELAKYLNVSESYINKKLDEIPHSAFTPIRFKKSDVDAWIKGELEVKKHRDMDKISIKNYKKNNFKVGE